MSVEPIPDPSSAPRSATPQFGCAQAFLAALLAVGILVLSVVADVTLSTGTPLTGHGSRQHAEFFAIVASIDLAIVIGAMFFLRPAVRTGRLTLWIGIVVGFSLSAMLNTLCAQL